MTIIIGSSTTSIVIITVAASSSLEIGTGGGKVPSILHTIYTIHRPHIRELGRHMCTYDFFPPISKHFFSADTCGGGGGGLSFHTRLRSRYSSSSFGFGNLKRPAVVGYGTRVRSCRPSAGCPPTIGTDFIPSHHQSIISYSYFITLINIMSCKYNYNNNNNICARYRRQVSSSC